ncbi:uncharacterized protein LOC127263804 [Andrographis paniculata]|uniref:uncharacterized protein LOC127263804 n=1 Tax=Andrographis paniculata TaxID=175694 RepID=UPI0021E713D6|nr:uncharacterized protein LOC127263804 [Andrographis paniculata]
MLLYVSTSANCSMICPKEKQSTPLPKLPHISLPAAHSHSLAAAVVSAAAAAALLLSAAAAEVPDETLSNIPQTLSSVCPPGDKGCRKSYRIQRPKSRKAEACTSKCVGTCIQGGFGSPGEGPFNIRRPLVVFKDTFRSRKYCLSECSDICNLIGDGDDGQ